ncbi:MAG: hypothetical protein RPT11_07065 [Bermanella sp.]
MLLVILGSLGHSATSVAGTTVSLRESYAGNLSFELTGGSFRTTQNNTSACTYDNSSSNTLNTLPIGASIVKAYLYWAASADGVNIDRQVRLNGVNINANRSYTEDTGSWQFFNGVADVTSQVTSSGNGTYTVSELNMYSSPSLCSSQTMLGGWALLVIYEHADEDFRVLNLYEGFESFQHRSFTLTPNNFELPSNPSGKHAHITWEGDDTLGSDGEYLAFEGVTLTDGNNPTDNQFNSYSNVQNGFISYGVDIDEYDISAQLTAGATQVRTKYSAGQDLVILSAEIVSVSNIPVADLSVSTANPTGWTQGATVTKKYTVSNNGPNDVPADSVRFSATLPTGVHFSGTQGDSGWSCTPNPNSGQTISCRFNAKLRSGWSDYLDLTFKVDENTAGNELTIDVAVDHDLAPYNIFDNRQGNNRYQFTVPVGSVPVIDLSASSKVYTNLSGDLLLAGDTLRYTITLDDASNLPVSGITVSDKLPDNISGYNIISSPVAPVFTSTGGSDTGTLTFNDISLTATSPGDSQQIILEVTINTDAPLGASLQNQATITQASNSWQVDSGDITLVAPDLSSSTVTTTDENGGLLQPGDTVNIVITLDDSQDLDISNLQATMNVPSQINDYSVLTMPNGASHNSGVHIDIQDIQFAAGETATITLAWVIDLAAADGSQLSVDTTLRLGSNSWLIQGPTLTVTNSTPSATGNKQLYLDASNIMSRLRPADGSIKIADESSQSWTLGPALMSDLTFSLTDIDLEFNVEGNRRRNNGNPRNNKVDLTISLSDSDGQLLADKRLNSITVRPDRIDAIATTLTKNPVIQEDTVTIGADKQLILSIHNQAGGSRAHNTAPNDRGVTLHMLDGINDTLKADGYSALILNASTVINVDTIQVWSAPFLDEPVDFIDDSGATVISSSFPDTQVSIRASVSDPFGAFDINLANINLTNPNDGSVSADVAMTQIDDPSDDLVTGSKQFEQTMTLNEADIDTMKGNWIITVTGIEGVEGMVSHTQVGTFLVKPFLPSIALTKTVNVVSDPINDTNNPKAIPGALIRYTIKAINSGRGKSDDSSLILQDEIPVNAELYIGDISCPANGLGPVCYQNGAAAHDSGLSYNFVTITDATDDVSFSEDGTDFNYEPVDAAGFDSNIRYIRITPAGFFKKASTDADGNPLNQPEFNFSYQVRLN